MSRFALYTYNNGLPTLLDLAADHSTLSAHLKSTVLFCQQWASDQQEFIVHTSGSTGTPKAIVLNRAQMRASALMTGKALHLQPGDKALICLNTAYIAGIMMLVRCMELQLEAHLIEPSSNPLEAIDPKIQIDFAAFVPLQVQTMLAKADQSLPFLNQMKAIIIGGAPVNYALEHAIQHIQSPVYLTYGMTETVSHIALRRLNGPEQTQKYKAFDEVHLGQDERGCLTIKSILTNDQPLITNDLVELYNNNEFKWLGRADQAINSGGVKIHPALVEQKLEKVFYQLNLDKRFFIAGIPHPLLGEAVTLFIENAEEQIDTSQLQQAMTAFLAKYELPKQIFYVERFLETATGKIDRLKTKELINNTAL